MAIEYKLSYTAAEIDRKLGKVDQLVPLSDFEILNNTVTALSQAAVKTDEQILTTEQKAQARENIGAADNEYIDDKISEVQDSIDALTASDVGADAAGTADTMVTTHNTSTSAHNDIRELISDLTTKLNNFLDVDDTTVDQLSEVITLINNNKGTLESLTTNKVNVSDIVDNLTTAVSSKVLSANQGVVIKNLIDTLQNELDTHTHEIADVTGLQSALDGKADASHGTHVTYSTTAPVMDGTASAGSASTVARSDHKHPTDTSRASQTDLDALAEVVGGKSDTNHKHGASDITSGTLSSDRLPTVPIEKGGTGATTALDALNNLGAIGYQRLLTSADDLNNVTEDGIYVYTTASRPANAPFENAAVIYVFGANSTTTQKIQIGVRYGEAGHFAFRPLYDGSWGEWKEVVTSLSDLGITATAAELNILDGVTATASEINKLDGLTATTTELNYVDGVTSNIQTQLDNKSNSEHKHSATDITSGTLPLERGGTGGTTAKAAEFNITGGMVESEAAVGDDNQMVFKYTTPSANQGTFVYKKASALWNYIVSKIRSTFGFSNDNVLAIANGGTNATTAADALTNLGAIGYKKILTADDDMDDVMEEGVYAYATSSKPANAPFENAAVVLVFGTSSDTTQKIQIGVRYGEAGHFAFRPLYGGTWLDWNELVPPSRTVNGKALSSNISLNATDVGAFSLSSAGSSISSNANLNDYKTPGNYTAIASVASTVTNSPYTALGFRLIVMTGYGGTRYHQMLLPATTNAVYYRSFNNSAWTAWANLSKTTLADLGITATASEINDMVDNASSSGSSGMVREFDSGTLSTTTYTYSGKKSKFYVVSLYNTSSGYITSIVVDYKRLSTTATSFYSSLSNGTTSAPNIVGVSVAIDSSGYPTFTRIGGSGDLLKGVCGYY